MCGIAGIVATHALRPDDRERVVRMRDVLAHRGPDGAGVFADGRAALGHRRLSIVDLAGGAQPLANEDGTIQIVFNGEIYNHADLRPRLEAAGHRYHTRSDTETIVHAYEQWGDDCVDHLRGMFAFAIWDAPRRRLLLARDRLGVKPLYWAQAGDRLLFASEIKAILESGLIEARANEAVLPEVLATRATAGEDTLFHGVHKLMPGHVLAFAGGQIRPRRYWDVPDGPDPAAPARSRAEEVEAFRALLDESVRVRLMSDVPLGVFLSGGIDSSAIAGLMARHVGRLQTFSVAFEDRACNELEYAREVAGAIGAENHEIIVGEQDFFSALPRLIWHEDEPVAHPSSVPLYFVSELARRHVKVVLTGEGSDELLAGYGKYPRALLNWRLGRLYASLVPGPVRRGLAGLVDRLPGRAGRYARRSFLSVEHAPDMTFFDNFAAVNLARQRQLLSPRLQSLLRERAYGSVMAAFDRPPSTRPLLDHLLYADLKTYLVELLMKQDQMSMAASIESRVPFLDHHLVEFAWRLPPDRKLSGFTTKRILRDAIADVVPRSILTRPKAGFPVPFGRWLQGGWHVVARDVLMDRQARERDLLAPAAVERLLQAAARGVHGSAEVVWSLVNLEVWFRTFIDGEGVQTLPSALPAARSGPATRSDAADPQLVAS
jgi:asparagine synthase (glutamine-hydrolysing)